MAPIDELDIRLIITGFGPFADHSYNPSWDAAQALAAAVEAEATQLPVTFDAAACFASEHLRESPDASLFFVHLGLAANRSHICFEQCAKNQRSGVGGHSVGDDAGEPLIDAGPTQRHPGVDVLSMVDGFNQMASREALKARISHDCGSFVCNALFYHSLGACEAARRRDRWADAIFIHIPTLSPRRARLLGTQLTGVVASTSRLRRF